VKGSITPEKLAMEKAHAVVHKQMKEAGGKSRSHTHHTLVFSLVLTAAYRIQGIPTGAHPEGGQQVAQKEPRELQAVQVACGGQAQGSSRCGGG
jgi:hypothetical protein